MDDTGWVAATAGPEDVGWPADSGPDGTGWVAATEEPEGTC
jgi:hypothetical protein